MKIVVINLDSAAPELLLGEERLTHLRRMMSSGCFGRLARGIEMDQSSSDPCPTILEEIKRNGGRPILVGVPSEHSTLQETIVSVMRRNFAAAREQLQSDEWTYINLKESGLAHLQEAFGDDHHIEEYFQVLDEELGALFAMIDDATAVLLASIDGHTSREIGGVFILFFPGLSGAGEIEGARLFDLAPTVLNLAGYPIPASMRGRSLVPWDGSHGSGQTVWFDFVDPSVEERLRGLGYLG